MTTPASLGHNREDIIRAASLIVVSGGITELRALDATVAGDRRVGIVSGYFDSSEKLADAVAQIKTAKGIYITMNVVNPDLLARAVNRVRLVGKGDPITADHDIKRRIWVLIDADPRRPSGISSTESEHAAALERVDRIRAYLRSQGWPDPIRADSGNGAHLLYRIDLAPDDGGLVQRCLVAIAAMFDDAIVKVDTGVYNAARIWKLYGTMACKGDATADRPHRLARMIDVPEKLEIVPEALLLALAAQAPAPGAPKAARAGAAPHGGLDLHQWVAHYLPDAQGPKPWQGSGEMWSIPTCPFNSDHTGGSAFVGRLPAGAITAGCHHESCQQWGWKELREKFDPAAARAHRPVGGVTGTTTPRYDPTNGGYGDGDRGTPPIPPYVPFPLEALPEAIRAYIVSTAKGMDVDPILIISPALAMFAGAVGNAVRVLVYKNWIEPCCVWAGVIALPGSLKTQTQDAATAPMLDAQRRANAEFDVLMQEYELACEEREVAKKQGKKSEPLPPPPEPPVRRQWMVSDTTTPALVQVLKGNPRGVVALHDELAAFFGGFGRFGKSANGGEPDAAFHKSAYSAKAHSENRKGENGRGVYTFLPAPLECVAGAIQPGAFQRIVTLQYIEDGLASRFMWAWPPDMPGGWVDEHSDDPKPGIDYAAAYERLCAIPLTIGLDGKLNPAFVALSLKARPLAKKWVNALRDLMREEGNGAVRAAFAKFKGGVFRMALLFHLIDWAGRGGAGPFGSISPSTLKRAITVIDWFVAEGKRVYSMLGESPDQTKTRELAEWISRGGKNREAGTATVRDVTHGLRAYRDDPDAAERALSGLVEAGTGCWEWVQSGPKGGPPSKRFRLSPPVTVTATTPDDPANEGSGDGDTTEEVADTFDDEPLPDKPHDGIPI